MPQQIASLVPFTSLLPSLLRKGIDIRKKTLEKVKDRRQEAGKEIKTYVDGSRRLICGLQGMVQDYHNRRGGCLE